MSSVKWMTTVVAIAALTAPAAAHAKPPSRGAEATVRAYAAALERGDVERLCAVVPWTFRNARQCRVEQRVELGDHRIRRARVGMFMARGSRARAVVDTVSGARSRLEVERTYVALRRRHGRWGVVVTGALPGVPYGQGRAPDLVPKGRTAALRRLADDVLVGLSGDPGSVCALLTPDGPLSRPRDGGCNQAVLFLFPTDGTGFSLHLASFSASALAPDRARLDISIAVTIGGGASLRIRRWSDRLYAVRRGGRWRLVKPSRAFYRVIGLPAPTDVDAPGATATWPATAIPPGTLTERPTPAACQRPQPFWPAGCAGVQSADFASLSGGGGLALWTVGWATEARAVAAGVATAPIAPVLGREGDRIRNVIDHGLVSVADGALAVIRDEADSAMEVLPLDAAGRPRGPAQPLLPPIEEGGDPEDVRDPVIVAAAPGAPNALLLTEDALIRLGPDGRRVSPDVPMRVVRDEIDDARAVAVQPDGTLLGIGDGTGQIEIASLRPDGRPAATGVHQRTEADLNLYSLAVVVGADGRVLIAWVEEDAARGRSLVRAWSYDPRSPLGSAPVTVASPRTRASERLDPSGDTAHLAVSALAGTGFGLAYALDNAVGADAGLWAARLDAGGAVAAGPRRLDAAPPGLEYVRTAFGIAGDTVSWIAAPPVGLSQLRAGPLP